MGVLTLTIGGVAYSIGSSAYDISTDVDIAATANGPARLSLIAVADAVGNIPAIDQEIVLSEDGTPIFGGYITEPEISGIAGNPTDPVQASINALDYNTLPSRRNVVSLTIPAGTLKAALTVLVAYLAGVTLDAAQPNGPTLTELVYTAWTVEQILNNLSQLSGGYVWRINPSKVLSMKTPGSVAAPFNLATGDGQTCGDVTVKTIRDTAQYGNNVVVLGHGVTSTRTNGGEVSAHGQWDLVVSAPDTTVQAACDALADALLASSTILLKQVAYSTELGGLDPGMTQTINFSTRGVNNTFLITEVRTRYRAQLGIREVTAIEGVVYKTGWREELQQLGSGSGSGTTLPSVTTSGSGSGTFRVAYFLGGSGDAQVESPTPTWVAASPMQVQVNTVARGTIQVQVTAQLRALTAGVSVRARLYDYTAAAACPELSAVITSTSWQTVTWTVTVNAGSHYYGLQLLPGTANEPVGAIGYLE